MELGKTYTSEKYPWSISGHWWKTNGMKAVRFTRPAPMPTSMSSVPASTAVCALTGPTTALLTQTAPTGRLSAFNQPSSGFACGHRLRLRREKILHHFLRNAMFVLHCLGELFALLHR